MAAAVVLVNGNMVGSSAGAQVGFVGGRSTLILSADIFGAGMYLQVLNQNGTWVAVNGTNYSANQVTGYDLPAGQYRMINNTSSSINVCATLVTIPYGG